MISYIKCYKYPYVNYWQVCTCDKCIYTLTYEGWMNITVLYAIYAIIWRSMLWYGMHVRMWYCMLWIIYDWYLMIIASLDYFPLSVIA